MKTPHSHRLLCTTLLAIGLQTYTATSCAVEPLTATSSPAPTSVVPVSAAPATLPALPALPSSTTEIIAQMIKGMIANSAWQKEATTEIYRLSDQRLIWLNNKQTEAALKFLSEAPASKGLHSEYYYSQWLNLNWQKLKATPDPTFEQLAFFDTTLSSSLLSYFSDLRYGRVNPKKVSFDFSVNKDHLKLAQLTFNAAKDGSFNTVADSLESQLVFYRNLKRALNQYQQAAREYKELHFKFAGGLKEGQSHPQIPELRRFLTTLGDVIGSKDTANSLVYDANLVAGVKNFQHRYGLGVNGILNNDTVAALNAPLADKISRIELGLERLRWVPTQTEDRLVLVNIPSFTLWAFESLKDEKVKPLTMRVVVGEALDKQTPSLSSMMNQIEFRPTWTVPQSIIKNEMMAKLENNPEYFAKRNMKVTYHGGKISIRQASGDNNALGLVKFLFPNNHAVYFHDTQAQKFFSRSRRDFSHGCVRLAEPEALAQYALKKQSGNWTEEKIKKAMHKGGSKRVTLENPIPVMILYNSAMAIDNRGVSFFQDIYGHDKRLKNALLLMQTKKKAS